MLGALFTLTDFECSTLSFSEFYSQNINKAMKIAYCILKDRPMAEDACSEAFIRIVKCYDRIKTFDDAQQCRYLALVVKSCANDILRQEAKQQKLIRIAAEDSIHLSDNSLSTYKYNYIVDCIKSLDDNYSEIMYLKYIFGLSCKDIASSLGITQSCARQRLHRARIELSNKLKEGFDI